MSDRKTISINPELFKVTSNTTRKKRKDDNPNKEIKVKAPKVQNNKTLRGKLLKYIRDQQEKNYREKMDSDSRSHNTHNDLMNKIPVKNPLEEFESDFDSSLQYLMTIAEENEKKQKTPHHHNSTIKQYPNQISSYIPTSMSDFENVSTILPEIFDTPPVMKINQPIYGCLKGGKLPTYRTWKNQTQRNYPPLQQNRVIPKVYPISTMENKMMPSMNDLEKEREKAKERIEMKKMAMQQKPKAQPKLKYLKQKKTLKRTYHVGKSKVAPKVTVLVSNKTIRSNVTTKSQLLKQTPMEEIRKFLIKKGLIKVGSTSPNDVLRKMYESVVMISGDVVNHNPDNLLYNFFNDK